MRIEDIKINGIENPVGFELDHLKLSWKVRERVSKKAENILIEVSDKADFSKCIWKKQGTNLDCTGEKVGVRVEPYTRYYCRVTVTGDAGDQGCGTTFFERGKGKTAWVGKFISTAEEDKFHPVFEKNFQVKSLTGAQEAVIRNGMSEKTASEKAISEDSALGNAAVENEMGIQKARLYVTGLGVYEAYINGKKAGEDILAPFYNDYREKIQYQTYDVTDHLLIGQENQISIYCGNGWYKGRLGYEGASQCYGTRFAAIVELHIWYEDGSETVVATDETWTYRGSDIEMSDLYDGEVLNRQLWKEKENTAKPVRLIEKDQGTLMGEISLTSSQLTERYSLPVKVKETLTVQEIIHTQAGEIVLDMGQNMVGFVEFDSNLPAGTKVILDFGEVLQQGNFYNDNYRTAKARYEYISDGRREKVRPHFTFFGFRYVRVTGWPGEVEPSVFRGCVVYSDLETTTYFDSSSAQLNRLAKNCMWGQKSNFLDMPTDCPQRDERLGWTGDAQVFAPTACYNMDTRAFYRKFLKDLHIEQRKQNGAIPNFIPNLGGLPGGSSVWGDVATFIPMVLYHHYGDKDELRQNYSMMKEWVDWIIRSEEQNGNQNLWNFGFHFGDWLAQDGISPQSMKGGTDDALVASLYYYASTGKVAEAAEILGYKLEAEYYHEKAEKIRGAILDEFFAVNGRLAIDTQTAYLMCLNFGVYRDKNKLISELKERLRKDCYKIKGGFVGATMLCQVLAQNGLEDVASYILFQEGFPGWMHCVNLGATTIWERWNSILDDGTISGTDMNSLNHYSYGSVMEYVYRYMAGIQEAEPGFKKVRFAPQLNNKLGYVTYSYDSVSGKYTSAWKINEDGTVTVRFEVPFGCSAVAVLPDVAEMKSFTELKDEKRENERSGTDGKENGSKENPQNLQEEIQLSAGIYEFCYRTNRDYRKAYTMNSRLEEMQNDPRAMEILARKLPLAVDKINSQDPENLNLSLNELQYMFFLGFNPEMVQSAAAELMHLDVVR